MKKQEIIKEINKFIKKYGSININEYAQPRINDSEDKFELVQYIYEDRIKTMTYSKKTNGRLWSDELSYKDLNNELLSKLLWIIDRKMFWEIMDVVMNNKGSYNIEEFNIILNEDQTKKEHIMTLNLSSFKVSCLDKNNKNELSTYDVDYKELQRNFLIQIYQIIIDGGISKKSNYNQPKPQIIKTKINHYLN